MVSGANWVNGFPPTRTLPAVLLVTATVRLFLSVGRKVLPPNKIPSVKGSLIFAARRLKSQPALPTAMSLPATVKVVSAEPSANSTPLPLALFLKPMETRELLEESMPSTVSSFTKIGLLDRISACTKVFWFIQFAKSLAWMVPLEPATSSPKAVPLSTKALASMDSCPVWMRLPCKTGAAGL